MICIDLVYEAWFLIKPNEIKNKWNINEKKSVANNFLGCDFMDWRNMSQTSNEILGQLTLTLEVCLFFEMMTDKISTTQEYTKSYIDGG